MISACIFLSKPGFSLAVLYVPSGGIYVSCLKNRIYFSRGPKASEQCDGFASEQLSPSLLDLLTVVTSGWVQSLSASVPPVECSLSGEKHSRVLEAAGGVCWG